MALFFIAGSVGMIAVLIMAVYGLAGVPFAFVAWSAAAHAAYRIWRMDYPEDSARAALRQRLGWYTGVAIDGAMSVGEEGPDQDGGESDGTRGGGTF